MRGAHMRRTDPLTSSSVGFLCQIGDMGDRKGKWS